VSTGGSTFSMCNRSQEWNINPQGLRRNSVTHGMEESSELAQVRCDRCDMRHNAAAPVARSRV